MLILLLHAVAMQEVLQGTDPNGRSIDLGASTSPLAQLGYRTDGTANTAEGIVAQNGLGSSHGIVHGTELPHKGGRICFGGTRRAAGPIDAAQTSRGLGLGLSKGLRCPLDAGDIVDVGAGGTKGSSSSPGD